MLRLYKSPESQPHNSIFEQEAHAPASCILHIIPSTLTQTQINPEAGTVQKTQEHSIIVIELTSNILESSMCNSEMTHSACGGWTRTRETLFTVLDTSKQLDILICRFSKTNLHPLSHIYVKTLNLQPQTARLLWLWLTQ